MAIFLAMPWHSGENDMHRLMRVEGLDNPTSPMLTPHAAFMLQQSPLLALGALDSNGRPWSTVWGGDAGFSRSLGSSIIGIRTTVDRQHDPVVQALCGGHEDGTFVQEPGQGRMLSGLAIDLSRRSRTKLAGRIVASTITKFDDNAGAEDLGLGQIQLITRIEQSLGVCLCLKSYDLADYSNKKIGNCPKYLNKKRIVEATPAPKLISSGPRLTEKGVALLENADLFFISTTNKDLDMDTNHRGGPPGFVRILSNDPNGTILIYPEYSGNRLYQTLGNLRVTPLAGLVFPDFATGDVLYATGTAEILVGRDAATVMPRCNLAVKITLSETRLVERGLSFRGVPGEPSPYNPAVRLLSSEGSLAGKLDKSFVNAATLIERTSITPTITRFRFSLNDLAKYKGGQWVAIDLSQELGMGYSHMRDDDPRSLNDDFVRTFTISSAPATSHGDLQEDFEITIRKMGPVTSFLFSQLARPGLGIALLGFGGDFEIRARADDQVIPFVAGGVGITPLLGQLPAIDISKLRLFWTLQLEDINLLVDTVERNPRLAPCLTVFLTGGNSEPEEDQKQKLKAIQKLQVQYHRRRMNKDDLLNVTAHTWYICTGPALRKSILQWLEGRVVIFEDFNF